MIRRHFNAPILLVLLGAAFAPAAIFAQADFYKGKNLTIIQGREAHEKAVREIPRDPEVIEVFKKLVGAGPLPPRR